ncbi:HDL049Cp [Eremothecium sinecaudum]|uniref:Glutamyl-tRNA(Gln) amidotransferase subunit F, mitochondrial n=1 Tax=Eremothecium sinecaudum TaxID=45286 RepID=A0A0X8HSJ8_9SACH|nr:HDL049Cp [Eremothecium sinecaudum]AMD20695.1 HDL049Cp [Eremothecium sinecaudum]
MLKCNMSLIRQYSSSVGRKFANKTDVVEFFSKSTWKSEDYLPKDGQKLQLPTEKEVKKLLRISGLPSDNWKKAQQKLANQLSFINHLQEVEVDNTIDPTHARILPRTVKPLSHTELQDFAEKQPKDASLGEISGSFDGSKLSTISEDGYFVIREGLLNDRK